MSKKQLTAVLRLIAELQEKARLLQESVNAATGQSVDGGTY